MGWKLYDLLGLPRGAPKDEIKKAYKKKALETHPDRGGDQEVFKQVNHAYTILSEDDTRSRYDQLGDEGFEASGGQNGGGGMNMDPHDIFRQFFGGAGGFNFHFNGGHGAEEQHNVRRGNHKHVFKIAMNEAYYGTKKSVKVVLHKSCFRCNDRCYACQGRGQITEMQRMGFFTQMLTRPCGQCNGSGMVTKGKSGCTECNGNGRYNQEKVISLDIPAGVDTGHNIVFEGMGEQPSKHGEQAGDLYIEIFVHPHERFTRQNNDLYLRQHITFRDSIIGTKIEIPHFSGAFQVDTAELGIIQPSKQYVIKGKGMTIRDKNDHGNLILNFDIQYPSKKITANDAIKINELFTEIGI